MIKIAFSLFLPPSNMHMFNVKNYDGILCEINVLRLRTDDNSNNTLISIIESSNTLDIVLPITNALGHLNINCFYGELR